MKDNQAILADHTFRHIVATGSYMDAIKAYFVRRYPGRAFIDLTSAELDADYYAAACKRYKEHAAQGDFFVSGELKAPEQIPMF